METTWSLELAVIDWIALALLVSGYFLGLNKGLGPVFGMVLFLIVAMFLGQRIGPFLLKQMPNTAADANNWHPQFMAYGAVTGTLLSLPILARILSARAGKKKDPVEVHSKHFGSLMGVIGAAMFFTLACPFMHRFETVAKSYRNAASPTLARQLASHMQYLYPAPHRKALDQTISGQGIGKGRKPTPRAAAKPKASNTGNRPQDSR